VVTPPHDCCCNSQSPEVMTPSADGMTSDIAVLSVHGTHLGRNIEALPGSKSLNLDYYFRRIRFLGRGRLGFVEKVASVASNKIYARKTIHRSQLNFEDRVDAETLNEELEILKSLRHSHLVRLIDIYTSGDYFYLFMSPVADGNLASFFYASQNGQLPQNPTKQKYLLLEWMSCLQSAVAYLQSQNVVHEDLKPENILVKENTIFLTNIKDLKQFAHQEIVEAMERSSRSMYCAPETVVYGIINDKSNTFSMGCISKMLTLHFDKGLLDF
jgi:serine/threonine protein kinase